MSSIINMLEQTLSLLISNWCDLLLIEGDTFLKKADNRMANSFVLSDWIMRFATTSEVDSNRFLFSSINKLAIFCSALL